MNPEVKKICAKFKGKTLEQYLDEHLIEQEPLTPMNPDAFEVFQKNFKGSEPVTLASTAAHAGLIQWDHPLLVCEVTLVGMKNLLEGKEVIPILNASSVPFSNQTHPGAIDLTRFYSKDGKPLKKYAIRGASRVCVRKAPPVTQEEVEKFLEKFSEVAKFPSSFPSLRMDRYELLVKFFKELPKHGKFMDQCIWLSSELWPFLYEDSVAKRASRLRTISSESMQYLDENPMADKKQRDALLTLEKRYNFWCHSPNYYRGWCKCGRLFPLEMRKDGSKIYLEGHCIKPGCEHHGKDADKYSVEVSDIPEAVRKVELNETLFIWFYKAWLLAGINVMGGCGQVEYLAHYKKGYADFFKLSGQKKRLEMLKGRRTDRLITNLFNIHNGNGTEKSGSQIVLEGGLTEDLLGQLLGMNVGRLLDVQDIFIDAFIDKKEVDYRKVASVLNSSELKGLITNGPVA